MAAHPLLSSITFASTPSEQRLVVIILRGGMDGLDVIRPVGDPTYQNYRPNLAREGIDLTGMFALHPKLETLMPLWSAGQLGFAHAVSTPYRDQRSHFDGQDLLEAGTAMGASSRGGWLNRLVGALPGSQVDTAFAVGSDELSILSGQENISRWSPDVDVDLSPALEDLLHHIYQPDPLFSQAAKDGMELAAMIEKTKLPALSNGERQDPVAAFAAERLKASTRIAAFSVSGWDTHQGQERGIGSALSKLSRSLMTLHETLGEVWGKTLVLAMTEFGRTVAENGTKGTDHGTAGAMVLAGGALRGGQVMGKWPGLEEADLYQRRDLLPTDDVRRYAGWALRSLFGVSRHDLERTIFPGLDLESEIRLTL